MNRKGSDFFTTNFLGIVIAIIGIAVFVYAFGKLYELNTNQETEKARTVLDSLNGKIEALPDYETGNVTLQGLKGWYLMGWSRDDSRKPNRCYDKSCICICREPSSDSCQSNGICQRISQANVLVRTAEFIGVSTPEDSFSSKIHRSCIPMLSQLFEVTLQKGITSLNVTASGNAKLDYADCLLYAPETQVPFSP